MVLLWAILIPLQYSRDINQMAITKYMARQKQPTTTRSIRLIDEIAKAVDDYADRELISSNAAVNKLLRDRLIEIGYLPSN
jgi:hypothetical protein